jgi:glycosyltransferase involved in cell wall biosynthesis
MKKKVLVIGALPPPTGGMETVMEQMMNFKFKDYELIPFNVAKTQLIKSNIIFNTVNFIYRCFKLFFIILIKKPEIIHIHVTVELDFLQKTIYQKIAKFLNKKTILHIHGGAFKEFYNNASKNKKKMINSALLSSNALITLSKGWREYYHKIVPGQKIYVLPNAIDLKIISKYKKLRKKSKEVRILYVGRVTKQKGIYELLEAMKLLKNHKIHLFVMGQYNDNEQAIKNICQNYKIQENISFLGNILGEERFKYYANADLFVLPSHWEGLPLSILEAMAFGLPIISTKVGAIPELITRNNGVLIKPGDIKSLEDAILKLSKIDHKVEKIRKNNMQKINKYYTVKHFEQNILHIYRGIQHEQ